MVIRVYYKPRGHVSVESVSSVFVTKPVDMIVCHLCALIRAFCAICETSQVEPVSV